MIETKPGQRASAHAPAMAVLLFAAASQACFAEVMGVASNGFEVREQVHVNAGTDTVYAMLLEPARWWNPKHTYSGRAANLTLDANAGGCWCEKLDDGGSVQHMSVVYVSPGKAIRLRGGLGPLQPMAVDGSLTFSVKSAGGGTDLTLDYAVGGYSKDGFESLSKGVDFVLMDQAARIKKLLETGAADSAKP